MKGRLLFLNGIAALGFILISFTVYNLQIGNGDYYVSRANAQNEAAQTFEAKRGNIYFTDKYGAKVPAAITKEFPKIFAVPKEIKNKGVDIEETARLLSEITGLEVGEIEEKLGKENREYELLVDKADEELAARVGRLGIEGIYVDAEKHRYYPLGEQGAQVLGFVGLSENNDLPTGLYGVEAYHNESLVGEARRFRFGSLTDSIPGEDINLTIDTNIQGQAEEILRNLMERYSAEGGSVIVQNPQTGEILAMVNAPNFDPNNYSEVGDVSNFRNAVVQSIYEPGSIFKIITVAAGIDSGAITPRTSFYDTGEAVLNGKTIRNWDLKAYGNMTIAEGIEHSVNTAMVFAEQRIGHETFYKYLKDFGLKEFSDIDLPGEALGSLAPLEKDIQDINYATASFGQGVSVTPIRLITAISAIANDGVLMRPYIDANKNPARVRRVVDVETARQVTDIMVSAVKINYVADIPHYDVAGKTGTAQVPDLKNGGYLEFSEGLINTYVGFAPASHPQFTILIKLDKPAGSPLAGQTVVPAFKELAEFILNYYQIPPDNLDD
ncbi:MAG: hypothetical protein COU09_02015 [Candidatus Harrisonbacteria bacterium CG10_big_fil_rev_8_21_14_0_10_44_23]|uniref:Penicillin-binding protein 2 n=1 Tax=Candidatus Harrisonbacteria bacterium CG10_big_fil_rev_8_21_14_0_10_44_23 TaxID=1974585 RepID=A0A2H0UQ26_9BACT|nr:MAG: hypothetical protein COU09_02015 [Candidatus Harrisonbacteria bacterium CG10_big_fil_rev_8_21_14_0_10_44_23]